MGRGLLQLDPDLGRRLAPDVRATVDAELSVPLGEIKAGEWTPAEAPPPGRLGYLVVEGKLLREVHVHDRWNAELIVKGDVVRPWQGEATSFVESRWTALERCVLAGIEVEAVQCMARWPALLESLIERLVGRSRQLAAHAAIGTLYRVEDRILYLFWQLAERCGERRGDEVLVGVELTHSQIARLVGARRPTVSASIGKLREDGLLSRNEAGWMLLGHLPPPPDEGAEGAVNLP